MTTFDNNSICENHLKYEVYKTVIKEKWVIYQKMCQWTKPILMDFQ